MTTLKVCSVSLLPWVELTEDGSNLKFGKGIFSETTKTLSMFCGFNFNLSTPKDLQWGEKVDNDWTGMIGMLSRNEADFASGPFAMNGDRFEAVDFTGIFMTNHVAILAGQPNNRGGGGFRSFSLFDTETWIGIGVSFLLCVLLSAVTEGCFVSKYRRKMKNGKTINFRGALKCYFWSYLGTLFNQGNFKNCNQCSTRIVLTTWWLSIFIFVNCIGGYLKASLTIRTDHKDIESIADILKHPDIIPYVHQGTAYEHYIKTSKSPELRQLWKLMKAKNSSHSHHTLYSEATLLQVLSGKAVILSDLYTMEYHVSKYCGRLSKVGSFYFSTETFMHHGFSIALRRGLDETISARIKRKSMEIFEAGLTQKWIADIYHKWHLCSQQTTNERNRPFALEDVKGMFYVWLMGLSGSLLCFLAELALKNCATR